MHCKGSCKMQEMCNWGQTMRHLLRGLILLTMLSVTSDSLADELRRNQNSFDPPKLEGSVYLTQADTQKDDRQAADDSAAGQISEQCVKFANDANADLGDVIRAGCKPTLAQMSALMDNPLGNVAMLFTQFDLYRLENQTNGKEADLGVYTGILQFPKKLNENWNLINRFIWTVPSMPLDQDKFDDFEFGFSEPSASRSRASWRPDRPSPPPARPTAQR